MSIQQIPSHLYPVSQLTTGCTLNAQPTAKTNQDGSTKTGKGPFEGMSAYACPVRVFTGESEVEVPGMGKQKTIDSQVISVTVWSREPITGLNEGDLVQFENACVGVIGEGRSVTVYYQATGVKPLAKTEQPNHGIGKRRAEGGDL